MNGFNVFYLISAVYLTAKVKCGSSSISLGPPVVHTEPGNHTVTVGDDFQFLCKIRANPLAHVAMKRNPLSSPITVRFPRYGSFPTGGNTIVLLDLMNLKLRDEGRYTCFAENKYGTVQSHGWLKFVKECSCHAYGVLDQLKQCNDDGKCICRENIGGEQCDKCAEGFFNFPFCMPCDCNPYGTVGGSASCDQYTGECNCLPDRAIFDPQKCDGCPDGEYFNVVNMKCQPCRCNPKGSESKQCNFMTGQCDCKDNFTGDKCSQCKDGYYDRNKGCKPCDCVPDNTYNYDTRCDGVTGQCNCRRDIASFTDSRRCASCPDNTVIGADGECKDCGCNPMGTRTCTARGVCECRENYTGIKCDECEPKYYGFEFGFCEPCTCNKYGTIGGSEQCDTQGNCPCKTGFNRYQPRKCDGCPENQYISLNSYDECTDCECHPTGSMQTQCALYDGQCPCKDNIGGRRCDECEDGAYGLLTLGECLPCNCDPEGSRSRSCDKNTGQCPCYQNYIFTDRRTCSGCPAGQYNVIGTCEPCNCNTWGSISMQCDSVGQCACQPTVQALKCDECKPGYFNFQPGGCHPCNCNPWGVADNDEVCNPVTGQCNCKAGQNKISSRTCDGCPPGYYANVNNPLQCFSCDCHPYGSTDSGCNLYTGVCDCGPNVKGDKCDECEEGFYGLNTLGECLPCQCDPEGSTVHTCNAFNGQCECKPGYGTIDPRTCEGCPSGMYLKDGICVPCGCNPEGSYSNLCTADGSCFCTANVKSTPGGKCDECEPSYYFGPSGIGCEPCGCNGKGTTDGGAYCDTQSGQCNCEESFLFFLDPRICEPCSIYQWNYNSECTDCGCHPKGSSDLQCAFYTGQCPCVDGAYGMTCDDCLDGYYDLDLGCLPCNCDPAGTINGDTSCDIFGQCNCKAGLIFTDPAKCATCGEGTYQNNGQCTDCDCHNPGSVNGTCDSATGQCFCWENVAGRRCDQCEPSYYFSASGTGCEPCDCNTNGTVGHSMICDQATGQCNCIDGQTKYASKTCDGCLNNFFVNEYLDPVTKECKPCNCLDAGSRQFNCSLYTGVCDCNPGIIGDKCGINPDAQGDTVIEGEMATLSCALPEGISDSSKWEGEGCVSNECGIAIEDPVFMSLSYVPQVDAVFTCHFRFGDVVLSRYPDVDVISFDITSLRVQSGSEVTLTASVDKMNEKPTGNIEWKRGDGLSCTKTSCNIPGHAVDEETSIRGTTTSFEATQTSKLSIGKVTTTTSIIYHASYRYRYKSFKKTSVVTVYECDCDPVGSKSNKCNPITLQCPCKNSFTGQHCTMCKDEFYSPKKLCNPCDCQPDNALSNLCDKSSGQCDCNEGSYIDTRRCEECPIGQYLLNGACIPCKCVTENTIQRSIACDDNGQCSCTGDEEYINTVTCQGCEEGYIIEDGVCVEEIDPITLCDCYPPGSNELECDLETLQCDCKENYKEQKCDTCKEGYYGPELGCVACNCNPDNSLSLICDPTSGQCVCDQAEGPFVDPARCGACADDKILKDGVCVLCPRGSFVKDNVCTYCEKGMYFVQGACVDCGCDPSGSRGNVCDRISGVCPCMPHYMGDRCDGCEQGYYDPKKGCLTCGCDPDNSLSEICDRNSGQCQCDDTKGPFVDTRSCESCPDRHIVSDNKCSECAPGTYIADNVCTFCRDGKYFGDGACTECTCDPEGSSSNVCDRVTGVCECEPGYEGDTCDSCQVGWYRLDKKCTQCLCNSENSISDVCDPNTGQCDCIDDRPYIETRTCTPCKEGLVIKENICQKCSEGTYIVEFECQDCLCSTSGTDHCNPKTGACSCNNNYIGKLCDMCEDSFYGYPDCTACQCSPDSASDVCDKSTGQCVCNDNFEGRTCDQCEDEYFGSECSDCECSPVALSSVCDKVSGKCDCPDNLFYKDEQRCVTCPENNMALPGQCVPCERGSELINNVCTPCTEGSYEVNGKCVLCKCIVEGTETCDKITGQCQCKDLYTGDTCDNCVAEHYNSKTGCAPCDCDPINRENNNCDENGQCTCKDNKYLLNARTCEKCPDDKYLSIFVANPTTKHEDRGVCLSCSMGYFVEENKCRTCDEGKFLRFGKCDECRCNPLGSISAICDPVTGKCTCGEKHQGQKCQTCKIGFYSEGMSQDCHDCGCFTKNTLGADKDRPGMIECDYSGKCYCLDGLSYVDMKTCETCPVGQIVKDDSCQYCPVETYYSSGSCKPCACNPEGSQNSICAIMSGICQCKNGYKGDKCDQCEAGFYKLEGKCEPCACASENSDSDVCNPVSGQCRCDDGKYDFPRTCANCPDGTFFDKVSKTCQDCRCYTPGSKSVKCDRNGLCDCQPNVIGVKCDQCRPSFHFDEGNGCISCECNRYGVRVSYDTITPSADMSCDQYTGQCNCKRGRTSYSSKQCDGCPSQEWLGNPADKKECIPCDCHPEGSRSFECHLYTGLCECNPQIVGEKCDTRGCEWGVWTYRPCSVTCGISGRDGERERYRKQHASAGGDFTTIVKVAVCEDTQTQIKPCRLRPCPGQKRG